MQFIIKCILFTLLALIGNANAQKSLSGLSGQDIVKVLAEFDELCPEKTPAGERWAPLASGKPCGSVPRCNFPHEWCAFKAKEGKKEVDWSSLKCQPLKPDCTNAILRKVGSLPPTTPTTVPTTTPLPTTTPPPTTPKPTTPEPTTPEPTTPKPTTPPPTTPKPTTTPPPTTPPPTTAPPTTTPPTTPPMSTTPPTTTPPASPTPPITPPPFTPPSVPGGGVMPPSGGALGCCDFHEYCCFWASKGFCESNRDFMVPICMQSCGTCGCTGDIKSCLVQVAPPCTLQNVMSGTACPCKPTDLAGPSRTTSIEMDIGLSAEEESETFKLVLHRTVDELCQYTAINGPLEPTAGFPPAAFSRSFVASLTEVTWSMLENWSKDVEAFAQHAKRSTVSVNDVRLLARRSSTLAARLDDVVEQETHHVGAAGGGTSTATKSKGKSSKSKPPPAVIYAKQPSIGEYDEDTFAPAPVKAVIDEYPTQEKGGAGKMKCQKLVDRTSPVYIIDDDGIEDLYRPSVKPYSYKPISSAYPRQQHQQQYQKTNPAPAASTALVDDDLDAALCALSDAELSKICEKPKKAAPVVSPAPAVVYDSDEDLWGKEDTGGGGWGQGSFGLRKETDQSKKMGNLGSFGMWEEEKDVVSTSSGRLRQGSGRETAWNNGKADDDDWMMECQASPPYQQTSASGRDTQRKFTFRPI